MSQIKYKRIMLKVSGEALGGDKGTGLAFQVIDDILDATSTPDVLGKSVGGDADHNKNTFLSFSTIPEAEPLGPARPLEALVICPCTGNTLAKLANGITDTPVCMAAKAHLRSDRPLLITLASNDALSANLRNVGALLSRKSVYFTPLRQDDPEKKPHSLVADFSLIAPTLTAAFEGKQFRKLFQ